MIQQYTDIDFLSDLHKIVDEKPQASQREIGQSIGISASLVNAMIKKCLKRGWIAVSHCNLSKLQYALTPDGITALTRRGIGFMRRNFSQFKSYSINISEHIRGVKMSGARKVVLYGESRLSFLIEWASAANDMAFECRSANSYACNKANGEFAIMGDNVSADCDCSAVSIFDIVK